MADNTAGDLGAVARLCGIEPAALASLLRIGLRATERVVTAFSQGVNQSSAGTDKANSIINVHLLTGRIGLPGAGPFSITGQPNAMGGREVGGIANMLAAHMELDDPEHRRNVQAFWRAPRIAIRPGLKAVDMFEAIHARHHQGGLDHGHQSGGSACRTPIARARHCGVASWSSCPTWSQTQTRRALAHVLLPAAAWGEKNGTVTNSDRHISRQRAFMALPPQARPDWWIMCEVAKRMGYSSGFDYPNAAAIFDEHARLSTIGNSGTRGFDIGGLAGLGRTAMRRSSPFNGQCRHLGPKPRCDPSRTDAFFTPMDEPAWCRPGRGPRNTAGTRNFHWY